MVSNFSPFPHQAPKISGKVGDKTAWMYSLALHVLLFAGMVLFAIFQGPKAEVSLQAFDLMNTGGGGGGGNGGGSGGPKGGGSLSMGQPGGQSEIVKSLLDEKELQGKHLIKELPVDSAKKAAEQALEAASVKPEESKHVAKKVIAPKHAKVSQKTVPKKLQKHAAVDHKMVEKPPKPPIEPQKRVFKTPKEAPVKSPEKMSYQEFIKKHGKLARVIKKKSVARARPSIQIPTINIKPMRADGAGFDGGDRTMGSKAAMSRAIKNGTKTANGRGIGGAMANNGQFLGDGRAASSASGGRGRDGLVGGGGSGGFGTGGAGGGLVGSMMGGEASIFQAYLLSVRNLVEQAWKKPPMRMRKKLVGVVEFTVDELGRCQKSEIFESSGNALFDASILDAFKALRQFPRPPNQKTCTFHLTFEETL